MPCLLCSRLNHILCRQSPELYEILFCSNQKSEISSMILYHIHGKLADGHKMCDDCLFSVTTKTKCNAETQILLGNLACKDLLFGSKGARLCTRQCTCCGKLWKSDQNSSRSIHLKSHGRVVLKPYIRFPCALKQSYLNHHNNLKKMRDKFPGSEGKGSFWPLSHVGYTEVTLNSNSESKFPFCNDDDDVSRVHDENIEVSNDPIAQVTSAPSSKYQCGEPNVSKHQDMNANCVKIGTKETTSTDTHMVVCDSAPINPKEENSSNMNKSSVTTEEREETGFIKEKPTIEEVNNMEALQYLRMMEEQAEYDNDELEKVNGLLKEKEKEIQDLEAEEKDYISQFLKNLEEKVHQIYLHAPNDRSEKLEVSKSNQQGASNENNHSKCPEPQISMPRRELELVALENQILDINDRLETLEFDHDLLEHLTNSLQNGNDGKQIIQDIAHQLYELQRIALR
ncbi:putative myosin-binding protein 4 [Glycine soja]|uniref:GTD-binding domain-containing protein n=2 Tax=Glycine subgen. Soja TaxID=1462606 RepID=K7M774_SOYBN|nr:putative myosin-binding protein 4 [Glycine soja]